MKLWVEPASGLVDEKVRISVEGLSPHEPVTVKAAVEESRMKFCAYGWFTSTGRGQMDLTSQASTHGTYTGKFVQTKAVSLFREDNSEILIWQTSMWNHIQPMCSSLIFF